MANDERKPWVIPVFFGILVALVWLIMDTMKPPKTGAMPAAPEESQTSSAEGSSPTAAGSAEAMSSTVR